MSPLPYAIARPFLFGLDPETAHALAMRSLGWSQRTQLARIYRSSTVSDPVELAGLTFPNRVGLAAGMDKNAQYIDGLGSLGFGFLEIGTVTPKPQAGNPKPRMFRLRRANALINRLGFNNDGLEAFIANVKRSALRKEHPAGARNALILGLNIGKNAATPIAHAIDDYLVCLDGVYPYADYITVNISSPNTKNLRALQNDHALDSLLSAIARRREELAERPAAHSAQGGDADPQARPARRVPLFVKIAPDLDRTQVEIIAAALQRHGMDGVVATNTTTSRAAVSGQLHAQEAGGLSGAPVLEPSNRVIRQLRAALGSKFPIVGVGGIMTAADAIGKIAAGADVVQLYTGLIYRGPVLVGEVARALHQLRNQPVRTGPGVV